MKNIRLEDRLIFALDVPQVSKAKDIVFCENCFKESKVIETIQFYRKF